MVRFFARPADQASLFDLLSREREEVYTPAQWSQGRFRHGTGKFCGYMRVFSTLRIAVCIHDLHQSLSAQVSARQDFAGRRGPPHLQSHL